MSRRFPASAGMLLALFLGVASAPASAQQGGADLNISPKRVVLGGANRSAVVYVFNRGTSAASYTIDLVDRVMLPDGQITSVDEIRTGTDAEAVAARLASAKAMISFSPRRVTLAPGESQTIRVRALTPPGLPAGEYRTHLTVATLPPEDAGLTVEQAVNEAEGELSARVIALLALSIPVIVRQGTAGGQVQLLDARLQRNSTNDPDSPPASVQVTLQRSGAGSIYGNLEVIAKKAGGKPESVGAIKGIAVYPEIPQRAASISLARAPAPGEGLEVRFTEDETATGKPVASADVDVR
jgi:P pilus assembly chaperone PapD